MIVAVDPGKVTGLATWYGGGKGSFNSWQDECWDAVEQVHDLLTHDTVEAVVCESYTITMQTLKKTRGENWSLESIGSLRYISRIAKVPFVLQSPADAKKFATDTKLKAAGWWNPTPGAHANDAARHLLVYLARTDRLSLVI